MNPTPKAAPGLSVEALQKIAGMQPLLEDSVHGPRDRCQHCGHAWQPYEKEHHSSGCAFVIARTALLVGAAGGHWIPVTNRLPEREHGTDTSREVIIFGAQGMQMRRVNYEHQHKDYDYGGPKVPAFDNSDATHWMEKPPAPGAQSPSPVGAPQGLTDAKAEELALAEIRALKTAIEGECEGLAISDGSASRILLYIESFRARSSGRLGTGALPASLDEGTLLTMAVDAGLFPNTIARWYPALKRYTDAVLAATPAGAVPEEPNWENPPIEIEGRLGVWLTSGSNDLNPHTKNLVVRFARAMAKKLLAAEVKYGYSDGWRTEDWMDECRAKLLEHIVKGDPVDVANYCAFLWFHGASTALPLSGGVQGDAAPYFVVLSPDGNEGVIFSSAADAKWTSTGNGLGFFGIPALGEAFRDLYDEDEFKIVEIAAISSQQDGGSGG